MIKLRTKDAAGVDKETQNQGVSATMRLVQKNKKK